MTGYRNVLIAVDLTDDSTAVAQKGLEVAGRFDAQVSLLHVVEFIPVDPTGEALLPPPVDLESDLLQSARLRLDALINELGLKQTPQRVEIGSIRNEIVRVAAEVKADLIVLGSHERHGLALLLGSTEKAILHKATCDVLAVRLN